MHTAVEVKRYVKGLSRESRLYVAEHEGQLYATNSYWLVPVEKVAPLLTKYNLSAFEPGAFEVNGDVRPTEQAPPNLGPIMPRFAELVELERVKVDGRPVFSGNPAGGFLELWRNGETLVALNADFSTFALEPGGEYETAVIMQKPGGLAAVSVWATLDGSKEKVLRGLVMPVRI